MRLRAQTKIFRENSAKIQFLDFSKECNLSFNLVCSIIFEVKEIIMVKIFVKIRNLKFLFYIAREKYMCTLVFGSRFIYFLGSPKYFSDTYIYNVCILPWGGGRIMSFSEQNE